MVDKNSEVHAKTDESRKEAPIGNSPEASSLDLSEESVMGSPRSAETRELHSRLEAIENLAIEGNELIGTLVKAVQKTASQGDLFRDLHKQIKGLKEDAVFRDRLKPVYLDLIKLYDRVASIRGSGEPDTDESKSPSSALVSVERELRQVLKRNGVEIIDVEGKEFNEAFSEAIDTRPVTDAADDMRVLAVHKLAFVHYGKLLRPAHVVVGKHTVSNEEDSNE